MSIANSEKSLAKTNKAQTLRDLEDETEAIHPETLPADSDKSTMAICIDHMTCVQNMGSRAEIHVFGDVLKIFMSIINEAFKNAQTVHIFSNKYDPYTQSKQVKERDVEVLSLLHKFMFVLRLKFCRKI